MIERFGNDNFTVSCSDCGREACFKETSWADMISCLKDDYWLIFKDGDEWQHRCPDCRD